MSPDLPAGEAPRGARRRVLRLLAALAVLGISALAGLWVAQKAGPERLRREIERRLTEVTGAPSRLPALEVRLGLPVEFVGRGLSLWDGAVEARELTARVSVAAALVGELRVNRLEAEGVVLRLHGGRGQTPSPPWLAPRRKRDADRAERSKAEAFFGGVVSVLRGVLERPRLADHIELRDARVELSWARDAGPLELVFDEVNGELWHGGILDQSTLELAASVVDDSGPRGRFELEAERSDGGEHRISLGIAELDLGVLGHWIPRETLRTAGAVSGIADLALPASESIETPAGLDFELLAHDLEVRSDVPLWSAPRASVRGRLETEAGLLRLREGRVLSDPLGLALQGSLTRPLRAGSELDLGLRIDTLDVEQLPGLLATVPALDGDSSRSVVDGLERGRLSAVSLSGAGSLSKWRDALSGKAGSLRRKLRVRAALDDFRIRLDRNDTIDRVSLRLELLGDHLSISNARGQRQGHPLPLLDIELEGLSHLLGADLAQRVPETDDVVLAGLPLLLSLFEPDPEAESEFRSPHIEVRIERLAHPTLLWPLRDLEVAVDGREGGLLAEIRRATWAGVPLHGQLDWIEDPSQLTAKVVLGANDEGAFVPSPAPARREGARSEWSRGRFEIGRFETRVWSHQRLVGDFRLQGSTVRFAGLEAEILPSGGARGSGEIDLGDPGSLPYRFELDGRGLDAAALLAQIGLGEELATGDMDLRGEIRNRYTPGRHPLADLGGVLHLSARNGEVRRNVPAVLALALSSDLFRLNPDGNNVRYDTCQATLEAEEGVVRTSAMQLEGPDVRLFGSGSLDLGHAPHPIDAEVAVFLLRPIDQALGSIPIVGNLLLGDSKNLLAAYFELRGPWKAPTATAQPLRSFYDRPMRMVGRIPGVVLRGVEALGDAIKLPPPAKESDPKAPPEAPPGAAEGTP